MKRKEKKRKEDGPWAAREKIEKVVRWATKWKEEAGEESWSTADIENSKPIQFFKTFLKFAN
jgi:hypothetical protein